MGSVPRTRLRAADEPAPAPEAPPRPSNIVMVLSDDLRADALGIAGHPFVRTPHFDMNGTVAVFPGYSTEVLTDHVIDWLRERDEAPFFLMLSFKSAHVPLLAHPRAAGIYGDVEIMPPIGYDDPPELLPKTV